MNFERWWAEQQDHLALDSTAMDHKIIARTAWDSAMTQHQVAANREIQLGLTIRWAQIVYGLCRREAKKMAKLREKRPFIPEPGKGDIAVMRRDACESIMELIGSQLPEDQNG